MPIICIENNLKTKGYLSIKDDNGFKGDYYIELLKENIEDDYELAILNNNKGYILDKLNKDTAERSNSEIYVFRGKFDNIGEYLENFDLRNVGLLLKCNSNPKDSIISYHQKKSFLAKDIQLIKNNNINKEYNKKSIIMNTTIANGTEYNDEKFININSNNECNGNIDKEQNDEIACSTSIDTKENITVSEKKSILKLETKDDLKEKNIVEPTIKTDNKENINSQINKNSQSFLSYEFTKKLKAKASLVEESSEYATTYITARISYNSFKAIDLALNPYYVMIDSVVSLFKYYARKNKVILLNIVFKKFSSEIKTIHLGIPIGNNLLNISGLSNINEYYFDENIGKYLIYKYDF